jgi:hypothetical protein
VTIQEKQHVFSASCLEYVSQWMSAIDQSVPRINFSPTNNKLATRKKKTINKIKKKMSSGKLFSKNGQPSSDSKSSDESDSQSDFRSDPKFLILCDKPPQKLTSADIQQIEQLLHCVGDSLFGFVFTR